MKKFIVITSIFEPTEAVRKFALLLDWKLVVVGDKKTPAAWSNQNVKLLSLEDQKNLAPELFSLLPFNSYSRKIMGYLYAIQQKADVIADTDDDNIPYGKWGVDINFDGSFETIQNEGFVNLYSLFTKKHVWPRGYPLNRILEKQKITSILQQNKVGIWQFLADEDPDVDAIYRLTNNTPIYFDKRDPLVLSDKTLSPFNSQNTFFKKELFPLLYLPAFVTFRYTDILRGLIAQPLLWSEGYKLGFGQATVIQKRNPHNYLKDFESEIPCYLYPEQVIEIVKSAINKKNSLAENMEAAYEALETNKIVQKEEFLLLKQWTKELKKTQENE